MDTDRRTTTCARRWDRILSLSIALVTFGTAGAAGQITISTAAGATGSIGESFDLPVMVDMTTHGGALGSFNLSLTWDSTTLAFVTGQPGSFGSVILNTDSASGGRLYVSGANPVGASGLVTLGTVRFTPLRIDTTTFTLSVTELYEAGSFANLLPIATIVNRQFCPGRGRYGDVNGDGMVNSGDALVALNNGVGLPTGGADLGLADVDADGDADPRDALVMLSAGAGLDVSAFRVNVVAPGSACAGAGGVTYGLTPDTVTALVGQSVTMVLLGTDSTGTAQSTILPSWSSSDSSVASVDSVGNVLALSPGVAMIRAQQDSSVAATGLVSVVADRTVHYVDGRNVGQVNLLGTSALPFENVNSALTFATTGDTIVLRPGRYPEGIVLSQAVVLMGDTTAGSRPLITASTVTGTGIDLTGSGTIELRGLDVDTVWIGVDVNGTDTVRIRDVNFVSNANGFASLYLDSAGVVYVTDSDFYGDVLTGTFSGNSAIHVNGGVRTLVIDSVTIANYGDYGIEIYALDSLDLRRSEIRNNWAYGVFSWRGDSLNPIGAVLEQNRITGHRDGSYYFRTARTFDSRRNFLQGGGGSGNYVEGFSGTRVSIFGDSVVNNPQRTHAQSHEVYRADSVFVDSVRTFDTTGRIIVQDVRVSVVRNSTFGASSFTWAVQAFGGPMFGSHDLIVRNLIVNGPDSAVCTRCGYGVQANQVDVDIDSLTADRMSTAVTVVGSQGVVRNAKVTDFSVGLHVSCGAVTIGVSTFSSGSTAIDGDGGCKSGDYLVADSLSITNVNQGIDSDDLPVTFTRSTVSGISGYGVIHLDSSLRIADVLIDAPYYNGIRADLNGGADSIVIERTVVDCTNSVYTLPIGFYLADGRIRAESDSAVACYTGLQTSLGFGPVVDVDLRNNHFSMGSGDLYGMRIEGSIGRQHVVGNTVTGVGPVNYDYGVWVGSAGYVRVDSNVIDQPRRAGIYTGAVDSLFVSDNQVLNQISSNATASGVAGAAAIVVSGSNVGVDVVEFRRNRVANTRRSGIWVERTNVNDSTVVLLDRNTVNVADTFGIMVEDYSNVRIQFNAVDSAGLDAVHLSRWVGLTARDSVWVNNNDFTNSGRYGINSVSYASNYDSVDATNNYWNDALGPSGVFGDTTGTSTGDSVAAFVRWDPWLAAPGGAPIPFAPPLGVPSFDRSPVTPNARFGRRVRGGNPMPEATAEVRVTEPQKPGPLRPRYEPAGAPSWFRMILEQDARRARQLDLEYQRDLERYRLGLEHLRSNQRRGDAKDDAGARGGRR